MKSTEPARHDIFLQLVKWLGLSLMMGILIGLIIGYFKQILSLANQIRGNHPTLIYGLPFAGIVISDVYVRVHRNEYSGENLLKSEVQQAAKNLPLYMIPAVFTASLLTTFFGVLYNVPLARTILGMELVPKKKFHY